VPEAECQIVYRLDGIVVHDPKCAPPK
jgi:hypothetical protein